VTILCPASQVDLRKVLDCDALDRMKDAAESGVAVCNHYFSQPSSIPAADLLVGLEASETSFCLYEDGEGILHYSTENPTVVAMDEDGERREEAIADNGTFLEKRLAGTGHRV